MASSLLIKGTIWTHDGFKNWLHINGGFIIDIGTGSPPAQLVSSSIRVVDYGTDKFIFPGFIDSHIHVVMVGNQDQIPLQDFSSLDSMISKLKEFDKNSSMFIIGYGWNQDSLGVDKFTRADLDKISTTKPVILFRNCYHLCVVNSFALNLFGLLNSAPDSGWADGTVASIQGFFVKELQRVKSGSSKMIELNAAGAPTGVLKETTLFEVKRFIYLNQHGTQESKEKSFLAGMQECVSNGLTSVQTNDFYDAWGVYRELVNADKLPLRVFLTVPYDETTENNDDDTIPLPDDEIGLLSCHRVKLFADGSLGAMTAALRDPYCHEKCKHDKGILISTEDEMFAKAKDATDRGYRLEIHVIGDQAALTVLNALERAGVSANNRPILTHCQILGLDLIKRMAKMGVIANIQPSFVPTDARWAIESLGKDSIRLKYSYAWKTLLQERVHVAGGSDSPVESCNPLLGMHAAIYRTYGDLNQKPSEMSVLHPHERLSFSEAINLYTTNGAFTAGEEDRLGQLRKGFRADFVVLDKKIWESDSSSPEGIDKTWNILRSTQVLEAWVNGKKTYSSI